MKMALLIAIHVAVIAPIILVMLIGIWESELMIQERKDQQTKTNHIRRTK